MSDYNLIKVLEEIAMHLKDANMLTSAKIQTDIRTSELDDVEKDSLVSQFTEFCDAKVKGKL